VPDGASQPSLAMVSTSLPIGGKYRGTTWIELYTFLGTFPVIVHTTRIAL
jgi:hypothetical protein